MPELIDKQKVQTGIALIAKYLAKSDAQKAIIGRILFMIDQMPTIEAKPVRHGWWIRRETVLDTECKCSVCGYKDFVPKHDNYWFRRKFCPNCGARMDGGTDNG